MRIMDTFISDIVLKKLNKYKYLIEKMFIIIEKFDLKRAFL